MLSAIAFGGIFQPASLDPTALYFEIQSGPFLLARGFLIADGGQMLREQVLT